MDKANPQAITVSVVSHGQGRLVVGLLEDLRHCPDVTTVIVTQNILEPDIVFPESIRSRVLLIRNERPLGFAANHNQAFRHCKTPMFAVLNPDIRLGNDPFPLLTTALAAARGAGVIAPVVRNPDGELEDSVRYFPTPLQLFSKLAGKGDGCIAIKGSMPQPVDWIAGMFLIFPSNIFRDISGFDEIFFLYYEDVDICIRLWKSGHRVLVHAGVSVVHKARRASRRKPRYMFWHLTSMIRYFYKHAWRLPRKEVRD